MVKKIYDFEENFKNELLKFNSVCDLKIMELIRYRLTPNSEIFQNNSEKFQKILKNLKYQKIISRVEISSI